MQATAMDSKSLQPHKVFSDGQHRGATYCKVCDKRKRPIRGLWERNGRYYAQITVEDANTGLKRVKRVPLEGATTSAQAVAKFQELLDDHLDRATGMFRREVRTTPEDVDKRVPRLLRSISKDTLNKMSKVLDAQQMEAFKYALDLEDRRFMQSNGVHEP